MSQGYSETALLTDLSAEVDILLTKVDSLATKVELLERRLSHPTAPASSQAAPSKAASRSSQYDSLAAEIPDLLGWALDLASSLRDSNLTRTERAQRAWGSGVWAKFCLEGRIPAPRPSRPIDLANSVYVVFKAPRHVCPLFCDTGATYRGVVGDFKDIISHGFPSKAEAKIYCGVAGFQWPERVFKWSPRH